VQKAVTSKDAQIKCCTLDMDLLQLETAAEETCFRSAIAGFDSGLNNFIKPIKLCLRIVPAYVPSMGSQIEPIISLYNYNCTEVFMWCPSRIPFRGQMNEYAATHKNIGRISIINKIVNPVYQMSVDNAHQLIVCESR
jgi:hypothetical protein